MKYVLTYIVLVTNGALSGSVDMESREHCFQTMLAFTQALNSPPSVELSASVSCAPKQEKPQ